MLFLVATGLCKIKQLDTYFQLTLLILSHRQSSGGDNRPLIIVGSNLCAQSGKRIWKLAWGVSLNKHDLMGKEDTSNLHISVLPIVPYGTNFIDPLWLKAWSEEFLHLFSYRVCRKKTKYFGTRIWRYVKSIGFGISQALNTCFPSYKNLWQFT